MGEFEPGEPNLEIYQDTVPPTDLKERAKDIALLVDPDFFDHPDNRAWFDRITSLGVSETTMEVLNRIEDSE
jgi:hypothetical protein